jgi:hypothetical protein
MDPSAMGGAPSGFKAPKLDFGKLMKRDKES